MDRQDIQPVARAELDALRQETAKDLLKLHAENLVLIKLMSDAHEREKQALLTMQEIVDRYSKQMQTLFADFVATTTAEREMQSVAHTDIN